MAENSGPSGPRIVTLWLIWLAWSPRGATAQRKAKVASGTGAVSS